MTIKWREQMSVDGAKIDEDHRHLIDIINQFEAESKHFNNAEDAVGFLHALRFYANTHFEREEQLQRVANYPYHDAHVQEHKSLIKKLNSIIEETRNCDKDALPKVTAAIAKLLASWLLDHVLQADLRMKPIVHAMRKHMNTMEKLSEFNP